MNPYQAIATGTVTSQLQGVARTSLDSVDASLASTQPQQAQVSTNLTNRRNAISAQMQLDEVVSNIALASALNESMNANSYITKLVQAEQKRLSGNMRKVKREQHRLSSDLLQNGYNRKYYGTAIWLVWMTMLVTLVIFAIGAAWRLVWIGEITAIVLVIAIVIVYLGVCFYTMNRMRLHRASYLGDPIWGVSSKSMRSSVGLE
jgi:ABC-type multidrug transport system fused ATPase/permease subunit